MSCTCRGLRSLTELCPHCEYAVDNCCTKCSDDVHGVFAFDGQDPVTKEHVRLCSECFVEAVKNWEEADV